MAVNGAFLHAGEANQGDACLFGDAGGERGGGGNGDEAADAERGGFGNHFIAGAAGHQHPARLEIGVFAGKMPQEFIQRVVAAYVFKGSLNFSLLHPGSGVERTCFGAQGLPAVKIGKGGGDVGKDDAAVPRNGADAGGSGGKAVHPAQAAAGAAVQAASAFF